MKIIRDFATPQNAINVQKVIQNLLAIELENLINTNSSHEDKLLLKQKRIEECA